MYDQSKVDRVINFLQKRCRNIQGEQAGELLNLLDWQKEFISQLFGEVLPDGKRRYTHGFLWIPKKNGKSTLTSGLSLYLLGPDDEPGAKVYALAGDKDQARIVFDDAKTMVEMDPYLTKEFKVLKNEIYYDRRKSIFRVLSAESETKHGFNVHGAVFDELHIQPNKNLWEAITKGIVSRPQPLIISLSNAGIKNTFPHEMFLICKDVERGNLEMPHWLVKIYEAPDEAEDDPFNFEYIKQCNPSFGITTNERYYDNIILETKARPTSLNDYLRLHLGKWVGAYQNWFNLNRCEKRNTFTEFDIKNWKILLKDYKCYVGVDLSSSKDLTSIALLFDTYDTLGYFIWIPFTYCPIERIKYRTTNENVNYEYWMKMKYIYPTPGNMIDLQEIFGDFLTATEELNVRGVGYDAWRADTFIGQVQEALGIEVFPITQTTKFLNDPTVLIERLMNTNKLRYDENKLIEWEFENIQIYEDINENIRIHKKASKDKVDSWSALVNAFAVYEHFRKKYRKPSLFVVETKTA